MNFQEQLDDLMRPHINNPELPDPPEGYKCWRVYKENDKYYAGSYIIALLYEKTRPAGIFRKEKTYLERGYWAYINSTLNDMVFASSPSDLSPGVIHEAAMEVMQYYYTDKLEPDVEEKYLGYYPPKKLGDT